MFLLLGRYLKPVDEVGVHLDAHRAWVREHAELGVFIAAGREVPLQGGLLVAVGVTREAVNAIIAKDPFIMGGCGRVRRARVRRGAGSTGGRGAAGLSPAVGSDAWVL